MRSLRDSRIAAALAATPSSSSSSVTSASSTVTVTTVARTTPLTTVSNATTSPLASSIQQRVTSNTRNSAEANSNNSTDAGRHRLWCQLRSNSYELLHSSWLLLITISISSLHTVRAWCADGDDSVVMSAAARARRRRESRQRQQVSGVSHWLLTTSLVNCLCDSH